MGYYTQELQSRPCSNIYVIIIGIFCAIFLTPYLAENIPRIIQVGIVSIWVLLAIIKIAITNLKVASIGLVVAVAVWYMIIILYRIIGPSTAAWGNYFIQIVFFLPILMFLFIKRYMSDKQKQLIARIILAISAINIIDNIRLNFVYPQASIKAVSLNWYPELAGLNIGVTSFNTMTLLFFCACLVVTLNTYSRKTKLLFMLLSGISAFYIIACGMRASVTLLLFLSLALIFYSRWALNNRVSKPAWIVLIILVFLIIGVFAEPILRLLISVSDSDRLTTRYRDLLSMLQFGTADEASLSDRIRLMLISLKSFASNISTIFFGIGDHRLWTGTSLSGFYASGIGGHSEFFDTLGRYGLLGAYVITNIFIKTYKHVFAGYVERRYLLQINCALLIFLLCGFTKSVFYPEIGIMLFLLIPLIPSLTGSSTENCQHRLAHKTD